MTYTLLHILHLLSAIFFIGTLFVEVAMLAQAKRSLDPIARETFERALGARSRVVLHWVVLFVYGAGIGLAWFHRGALADPFASSFGLMLSLKILLAIGVFLSFGLVAILLRRGRMSPARYHTLHVVILAQMVGIALLAKGMFYLTW
jgi:hypothetical protein